MHFTRLSYFYVAGYLFPAGIMLLVAPQFAMRLLLSTGDYGDIFPRFAGMLLIGLGVLIVQMIHLRLDALYTTTMFIRLFFCCFFVVLYRMSRDPFFLVLLGIVGFGLILTATSYWVDRRRSLG